MYVSDMMKFNLICGSIMTTNMLFHNLLVPALLFIFMYVAATLEYLQKTRKPRWLRR